MVQSFGAETCPSCESLRQRKWAMRVSVETSWPVFIRPLLVSRLLARWLLYEQVNQVSHGVEYYCSSSCQRRSLFICGITKHLHPGCACSKHSTRRVFNHHATLRFNMTLRSGIEEKIWCRLTTRNHR